MEDMNFNMDHEAFVTTDEAMMDEKTSFMKTPLAPAGSPAALLIGIGVAVGTGILAAGAGYVTQRVIHDGGFKNAWSNWKTETKLKTEIRKARQAKGKKAAESKEEPKEGE